MLPVKHRLHQEKDIKKTIGLGRSVYSPYFRLKFAKNNLGALRVTVVISAKVSKKATVRNRLKRQIREIFRLNLDKINQNFDLVINANAKALELDFQSIKDQISDLLFKAKLLK